MNSENWCLQCGKYDEPILAASRSNSVRESQTYLSFHYGVPQGSVLCPALLCRLIPLGRLLWSIKAYLLSTLSDIQLYLFIMWCDLVYSQSFIFFFRVCIRHVWFNFSKLYIFIKPHISNEVKAHHCIWAIESNIIIFHEMILWIEKSNVLISG